MKQSHYKQLLALLDDIKDVDRMIRLHSGGDSFFMANQYKAKKEKLVGSIIDKLVSPPIVSARSIHTVQLVINRFYGDEMIAMQKQPFNDDLSELEHALAR